MAFNLSLKNRKRTTVSMRDIDSMGGLEFETFVGELLKSIGYTGVQVTKSSGDQGVDVLAVKDGKKYAIQCKNYSSPLNNKPIQEVTTGKAIYGCDIGVVLTNSTFNQNAIEAATATGTLLWDRSDLQQMLDQSPYGRITEENSVPVQTQNVQTYHAPTGENTVPVFETKAETKPKSKGLYITGLILSIFGGMGLFAGTVTMLSSGMGGDDIPPYIFMLILFGLGMYFVIKNKTTKKGSSQTYQPHVGKPISWVAVGICLYFFFPLGFYLLYKKMSQYSNAEEVLRNSRTLKNWAVVFFCLGGFTIVMAISAGAEMLIAVALFVALGIVLLRKSKSFEKLYQNIPASQKQPVVNPAVNNTNQTIADQSPQVEESQSGGNFEEYHYNAGTVDSTYVVVHCKGCNAPNRIVKGSVAECEYCGAPVGETITVEESLDNEEIAISKAFAVIQRLLESLDEVSDDLTDGFDRLHLAMETFPNRSMPLDVELTRVSGYLNRFTSESKRISAGVRAQVMIACDNLMGYDDESWEKVENEIEQLSEIKSSLSETISSMRSFRHTVDTLNVNAGFQTYRIKSAQMQLVREIDNSLAILQSSMTDFSESLKIFRNAKFTSKTKRISARKQRGDI